MMFVGNGGVLALGKISESQWEEVTLIQQNQRTLDVWGGGLILSGEHLKLEKVYWYYIQWGWTDGKPSMI